MQRCPYLHKLADLILLIWQCSVSVYRMNTISIKIPAVLFLVNGDPEIHMKNKGSKIAKES